MMRHVAYYLQKLAIYSLRGHSSVVEHSTADREVTGSIPVAPFDLNFFFEWLLKKTHTVGNTNRASLAFFK